MARPKGKSSNPGVWVRKNRHGRLYAQWVDPQSGEIERLALSALVEAGRIDRPTKAAAATWLKEKSAELARMKAAGVKRLEGLKAQWSAIEGSYLDHFTAEHGAQAAKRCQRDYLRHWRAFAKAQDLQSGGDLERRALPLFRNALRGKPAYRNRILGSVRAFLQWAIDAEHLRLHSDDLRKHFKPFKLESWLPRVLDTAEIKRLLAALVRHDTARYRAGRLNRAAYFDKDGKPSGEFRYQPLAVYALLCLLTGARPGEVLSLKWSDVDLAGSRIKIWGSKTGRQRMVIVNSPALLSMLAAWRLKTGGSNYVCGDWRDKDGTVRPMEVHDRQWKRLVGLASPKLVVPVKVLRATCVAHTASAGAESETLLMERFGHLPETSMRHYRRAIHGIAGACLDDWYGVRKELDDTLRALDLKATSPAVRAG